MGSNNAFDDYKLDYARLHFDTNAIHAGQEPDQWTSRAVVPPISLATTFKQRAPAEPFPPHRYLHCPTGGRHLYVAAKAVALVAAPFAFLLVCDMRAAQGGTAHV
ncbi:hypothetical protein HPB50_022256 [Hyalomma asiaticum]|uniref:Uncharacterized protein n=1 Tax=Hyalomma asiaticum TaxID=266040 RepID=A0ACB7T468_HYAAI|nr:hypothetical protein HPB50_022256 [Hyalomma asiaticum]